MDLNASVTPKIESASDKTAKLKQQLAQARTRKTGVDNVSAEYPSLQMYVIPPTETISLQEFEDYAVERLLVLRSIERANLRGSIKFSEEWKNSLTADLDKQNLKHFIRMNRDTPEAADRRRKDHISHFILRLAFCRSQELVRWFTAQETDLFRFRFLQESDAGVKAFLAENNFNFTPISAADRTRMNNNLLDAYQHLGPLTGVDFYSVSFVNMVEIIRTRKVYMERGFAIIPSVEVHTIVASHFRTHISKSLARTSRMFSVVESDERLSSILKDFEKRYTGKDYNAAKNTEDIQPEQIDRLCRESFPPCMQQLHFQLKANNHLKHHGRQQYGLFLKGIGVTLENALKFWKAEFKTYTDEEFHKRYSYNIRHNYGKEGKRANYTPHSCIKIITGTIGAGDNHGCPFRHTDLPTLKSRLQGNKFQDSDISDISDLIEKNHYQIACQRYFEVVHKTKLDQGINHPNQYYEESRKIITGVVEPVQKSEASKDVRTFRGVLDTVSNVKLEAKTEVPIKKEEQSVEEMLTEGDDDLLNNIDMESL